MTLAERLREIDALWAAATRGPWAWEADGDESRIYMPGDRNQAWVRSNQQDSDAAFIVALVNYGLLHLQHNGA